MKTFSPLLKFKKNIHSQNGEDGILDEIIKLLGLDCPHWVCEFGAWDGIHLSNTFALVEQEWQAVYIEGDPEKYIDLLATANAFSNVIPINKFVARGGDLDSILAKTPIPRHFGVLSIDIDTYDLDVWEDLKDYMPAIVVIEINSSIPPGVIHRHTDSQSGNSFTSTVFVGKAKGYELVCHTGNLIFVHNKYVKKLNLPTKLFINPEVLFLSSWIDNKTLGILGRLKRKIQGFWGLYD